VRPNWVFQVAEIADDVDVGGKFPRLAALGWLSCTYQAGEVGTEMSVHGTKREFSPERLKGRKPPHCRRSGLNVGSPPHCRRAADRCWKSAH